MDCVLPLSRDAFEIRELRWMQTKLPMVVPGRFTARNRYILSRLINMTMFYRETSCGDGSRYFRIALSIRATLQNLSYH
jgi:hypothetical protein